MHRRLIRFGAVYLAASASERNGLAFAKPLQKTAIVF